MERRGTAADPGLEDAFQWEVMSVSGRRGSKGATSACYGTYDPFLGSGTALVAAESLRRVCYAMEIESKYAAVCLDRMQRFGLEPHLLAG
jgi:hypothetical protein